MPGEEYTFVELTYPTQPPWVHRVWIASVAAALVLGGLLLVFAFLPYEAAKPLVDSLGKDGQVESFDPLAHAKIARLALGMGSGLLALTAVLVLGRRRVEPWVGRLVLGSARLPGVLRANAAELLAQARLGLAAKPYTAGWLVLAAGMAGCGALFISQPMRYDESYTFLAFAARPFRYVISDYHLPNNHVFHTVLVYLSYHLLGYQPWMVRLPAYLAGVLAVPALYAAGSRLYSRPVGLLAAALLVASPEWLEYATNARGYTLVALFSVLALVLADFVRRNPNALAWGLLSLCAALGLYTVPVMLYPAAVVYLWLLLSWGVKDTHPRYGRWGFLAALAASGLLAGSLAVLLYLPVLRSAGVEALAGNRFVTTLGWEAFLESIGGKLAVTWQIWNRDMPPGYSLAWGAGLALSLVLHRRAAQHRVPTSLALLLGVGGVLAVQQVAPQPRIWLFLLPLLCLWGAAGLLALLPGRLHRRQDHWALAAGVLVAAGLLGANLVRTQAAAPFKAPGTRGEAEAMVVYLKDILRPQDVVVTAIPLNYPVRYYFMLHGLPLQQMCGARCQPGFQRAFVLVNERDGQTLESVIQKVDVGQYLDLQSGRQLHKYVATSIYEFQARP